MQISTKSTTQFLSYSCFKNGTQKQKFPIWKIPIEETFSLSNRTMLQLTELGDTVEFLSRNTPDFISPLPWLPNSTDLNPMDYEVWGVLQHRVIAGFATSTTWNSISSRSGVASTRTSLTEQFDSGVFGYAYVSVQTAATVSTNCNWCFCVRTAKATFPYWKLLF